ncbi:MAG: CGNR zinc finger domain-containing protein [Candidatus Velamenicoccus archaeovorus]
MTRATHPDLTPSAPGSLELVRSFLSLHDHEGDPEVSLPPSSRTVRAFLVDRGLLGPQERAGEAQLAWARRVHAALHRIVEAGPEAAPPGDVREIERAAREAGLRPRFDGHPPGLEPTRGGVAGAIGRILAIAFLARIDGSWDHLKVCANETCTAVFFDRSKNHSGRWCSMQVCGNRSKVRAWRERQRAGHGATA